MWWCGVAMAQSYLDVSVGRLEGTYDTGINSSVDSLTARYGYFGTDYFANISASWLHMDVEGLASQSGPGDVILGAGYIYHAPDQSYSVFPSFSIKIPTASDTDNLGSGETDVGFYVDGLHRCGAVTCSASMGYVVMGDPSGIDFENIVQLSAGVYKSFEQSALNVYLQYQTALIKGLTDPVSLGGNWFYIFNLQTSVYINGSVGLNDAAADYGIRTGIVQWF